MREVPTDECNSAKPVYRPGRRPHNVPEGEPPDTYICHRCHVKGERDDLPHSFIR